MITPRLLLENKSTVEAWILPATEGSPYAEKQREIIDGILHGETVWARRQLTELIAKLDWDTSNPTPEYNNQ
jgi:hypothetical protein